MDGLSSIPVENHLNNQYTRGFGHAPFIQALGDFYGPLFDRKLDVNNEILVTVGAYYSLYAATQGIYKKANGFGGFFLDIFVIFE